MGQRNRSLGGLWPVFPFINNSNPNRVYVVKMAGHAVSVE